MISLADRTPVQDRESERAPLRRIPPRWIVLLNLIEKRNPYARLEVMVYCF